MVNEGVIIKNFVETNFSKQDLVLFAKKNDKLFVDPFSCHVDLDEYIVKLLKFGTVIVAIKDNIIVGVAAGYMNDFKTFTGHLQYLLVDDSCWGLGVGKKLCVAFCETAEIVGMAKMLLVVDCENQKAEKLYRSLGFFDYPILHQNNKKRNMIKYLYSHKNDINIENAQKILYEMAKNVVEILSNNNIPYMIAFGTLLGAVRHEGFIPWDDDFDLFLFSDTYQQALDVLNKELSNKYFLEYFHSEPLYFHEYAHVKDKNSVCLCKQYPQDGIYTHNGLSIDLYCLTEMNYADLEMFLINKRAEYLKRKLNVGLIYEENYKEQMDLINRELQELEVCFNEEKVFAMTLNEKMMFKKHVFPLKKYKFCDYEFLGPNNSDAILKQFYGDYMKLPEIEKRKPHYSVIKELK